MLWITTAALAAATPQYAASGPARALVQAQATVRIIAPARIHFDGRAGADAPPPSNGVVHAEGSAQRARLIEFQ